MARRRRRNPPLGAGMYLLLGGLAYLVYRRWQAAQVMAVARTLPVML